MLARAQKGGPERLKGKIKVGRVETRGRRVSSKAHEPSTPFLIMIILSPAFVARPLPAWISVASSAGWSSTQTQRRRGPKKKINRREDDDPTDPPALSNVATPPSATLAACQTKAGVEES